jgi:hypothetical protein
MGAWLAEQVAAGKSPAEAYRRAVADAEAEYGHQEGYSGAINSKGYSFVPVELPSRFTYRKFQALLEDFVDVEQEIESAKDDVSAFSPGGFRNQTGKVRGSKGALAKAKRELAKAQARRERLLRNVSPELARRVPSLATTYFEKWGDPLCVELRGVEAKTYRVDRKRGERLYIFFGYAPS